MKIRRQQGFTLPELVVVVAVVIIFLAVALVIAHPKDYAPQTRDANRWVALAQLMHAIGGYVADQGSLPPGITDKPQAMGSESGMFNVCPALVPKYLDDVAYDPLIGVSTATTNCLEKGAAYDTAYTIAKTKDNKLTLAAPIAEDGEAISITKQF